MTGTEERGFDPRRHSMVALQVQEKRVGATGYRADHPVKHFTIGPHVPSLSLRRSAATNQQSKRPATASPKFLDASGKWVQDELPVRIQNTQSQSLTATATITSRVPGSHGRSLRPVSGVHSYNDISPVITAEWTHDNDEDALRASKAMQRTASAGRSRSASPATAKAAADGKPSLITADASMGHTTTTATSQTMLLSNPHKTATDLYWNITGNGLTINDLSRINELGRNVVPGTPNTRLIGSKWRYVPRPADGDMVYTDYYGRYGSNQCAYYGRVYHTQTAEFAKNQLVGDSDYQRVQASMMGIHALRGRPGLSMNATIAHSLDPNKLNDLSADRVKHATGIHKISEFHLMRPAATAWVN